MSKAEKLLEKIGGLVLSSKNPDYDKLKSHLLRHGKLVKDFNSRGTQIKVYKLNGHEFSHSEGDNLDSIHGGPEAISHLKEKAK
jgi:hypothetical protein